MPHTRRTLKLTKKWDITLNLSGGLEVTAGAAATAQNVANEARLFTEDAYFIQDKGIPHFVIQLGQRLGPSILRSYLRRAAMSVPDVKEVLAVNITSFNPVTSILSH